ncbi:MAG: JAB domain-containing protein [Ignavibacteria bacterium]|nr:JAB domain-containing protein [Ignavibacteria bacterium]
MEQGKQGRSIKEGSYYHTKIRDWPEGERPREKLSRHGANSLTEAELLAILIRTGTRGATAVDVAKKLLSETRSLRELARMNVSDLTRRGIGPARAATIVAAFELHRRIPPDDTAKLPTISSPEDVVHWFLPKLTDLMHEEFWVLLLSSSNKLLKALRVTVGTLNTSLVHPRECFHEALKEKAAAVVFMHNHPSGNAEPSQEDITITRQLVESGRILGIPVHDHIIIAGSRYVSFAERGLL